MALAGFILDFFWSGLAGNVVAGLLVMAIVWVVIVYGFNRE